MSRIFILGVPVDAVSRREAVERIRGMLASNAQHHVMTPNSEMIVTSTKNKEFHNLLNTSDLNLPDSAGLLWAAKWTRQHLPERVTGVDTVINLCRSLNAEHPVFLLGAGEGVAEKAAEKLKASNPQLKIAGTFAGSPWEDAEDLIRRINESGAHLLLVAYGAPAQDIWIDQHIKHMPHVRVAMGVGGTFDFLAGVRSRAPKWMQKMGLEWLWRLIKEPRRIGRIINAVIVFPILVLTRSKDLR